MSLSLILGFLCNFSYKGEQKFRSVHLTGTVLILENFRVGVKICTFEWCARLWCQLSLRKLREETKKKADYWQNDSFPWNSLVNWPYVA